MLHYFSLNFLLTVYSSFYELNNKSWCILVPFQEWCVQRVKNLSTVKYLLPLQLSLFPTSSAKIKTFYQQRNLQNYSAANFLNLNQVFPHFRIQEVRVLAQDFLGDMITKSATFGEKNKPQIIRFCKLLIFPPGLSNPNEVLDNNILILSSYTDK